MLVSVLVLGILGCTQGITETEVDAYIQGAWGSLFTSPAGGMDPIGSVDDQITLYISANQMTVKNAVGVSNPFRVEFSYGGQNYDGAKNSFKQRIDVAALSGGAAFWVPGAATDDTNTVVGLLKAVGLGDIVSGDDYITNGEMKVLLDKYLERSISLSFFPNWDGVDDTDILDEVDVFVLAAVLSGIIPVNASEVIVGDLQMYTWENNIDLGKFKTLMVAGAATNLYILKFTPPSGDSWWYKYDNVLTKPPVGSYIIKGQM